MNKERKKPEADLRKYYTVFLEVGLILVLVIFIIAMKIDFRGGELNTDLVEEQETVEMEEIERTKQEETPPPPPKPKVPVEVPNDEIIEDEILDLDAELNQDERLEMPPPPEEEGDEESFFRAVEDMPERKTTMDELYDCIEYPAAARRANIEGRVIIQFIVDESGNVTEPTILRDIGGGAGEEALRCVRQMKWTPGRQRGEPVRVMMSQPVIFKLGNL